MVGRWRFAAQYVAGIAAQSPFAERSGYRLVVDEPAAGRVDEHQSGTALGEQRGVDKGAVVGRQRAVE